MVYLSLVKQQTGIKDCTIVEIKDSSHEIFLDQPQQTHLELDKFVTERIVPMTNYMNQIN
jgi:spermidine synthase